MGTEIISLFGRWMVGSVYFFPRDTPKCPWHTYFGILTRALLTFHGHIIEDCHGQGQKFHGHFFQNCHGQVGKFHGLSNIVVTGTLTFVTGTFVLWSQNFRSHNKGDILESRFKGLQFMRLFVFEKNKLVFGYRVFTGLTPKMTNPLNKNLCWKVAKLEARLSKGRLTFKSSNL